MLFRIFTLIALLGGIIAPLIPIDYKRKKAHLRRKRQYRIDRSVSDYAVDEQGYIVENHHSTRKSH